MKTCAAFNSNLIGQGTSSITLKATIVGLKFHFDVKLGRPEVMAKKQSVRVPHKLSVILNKDEVIRLIAFAGHIKHQTSVPLAYGTGLRPRMVVAIKFGDVEQAHDAARGAR